MNGPLVSIIMPVYNAGEYLRPALESILTQTYRNIEVLIVDDGSTDYCINSISNIEDSRVRIIRQANFGRAAALNRALEQMTGQYYAIQDADDISHPQRIERQFRCMEQNPNLAAVFCGHEMILDGRLVAPLFSSKSTEQCAKDIENFSMPAHDPTGMFRVSIVRDIRYEPGLKVGAGLDYILRIGELYPMMVLGACLYCYRVHQASNSRRDIKRRKEMVRLVMMRACQRRRIDYAKRFGNKPADSGDFSYREKENGIVAHFMRSVLDLRSANRLSDAFKTMLMCIRLHPLDLYYYKPFVYFLTPLTIINCYRGIKAWRTAARFHVGA